MAGQAPPYCPNRTDFQILGLYQVMVFKIQDCLREVLVWATPRRQNRQTFYDYLQNVKGMSEAELKKRFNKGQLDKMKSDPDMTSFDVSLTYLCLRFGSDGLAPPNDDSWKKESDTLEGRLTCAKNFRNDFVHGDYVLNDQLYYDKIEEIRKLLCRLMNEAAQHFTRDPAAVVLLLNDFNDKLNDIRDFPFNTSASSLIFEQLCTLLKTQGRSELKEKYKAPSSISPASNLFGRNLLVEVKEIFTKLQIRRADGSQELIPVDNLFEYVHTLNSNKVLLIVEGVAGAGKTTLTRKILQVWSEMSSQMKNLDNYDLAFWLECRDRGTSSLAHLLRSLMPNTTQKIQGDAQVNMCIQENELLFVVDGLDELNASSETVLREILNLKNTDNITIICTTRPNKVLNIKRWVPDTFDIHHVKIDGIAEQARRAFVINYIQALERHVGRKDPSGIIRYLKMSKGHLREHWRLPFNLVLLTILWLEEPDIVNEMTTETELFVKTFDLCKKKLTHRLYHNETTSRLSDYDIEANLSLFVKEMITTAFASQCDDEIVLSETSVRKLRETCRKQNMPHEEFLGAFLVQTASLLQGNLEKISFPHKGLQDFYCALHIKETLDHQDRHNDIRPTVRSVFEEALRKVAKRTPVQFDLRKWMNALVHLTGLLYQQDGSLTDERAEEMVKLLEESGMNHSGDWFHVLSNVKCDTAISRHIVLRGKIIVTDVRVQAFLEVLHNAVPGSVDIYIEGKPSTVPCLKELLVALQKKSCNVSLHFHHDFQFPEEGVSILEETLLNLFP